MTGQNKENISKDKAAEMDKQETAVGSRPKKRKLRPWVFWSSCALALFILVYGGVALYYQTHFFPGTRINNLDCGNLTQESAAILVEQKACEYTLTVKGRDWQAALAAAEELERAAREEGEQEPRQETEQKAKPEAGGFRATERVILGTVEGKDILLSAVNVGQAVEKILKGQNPYTWPRAMAGKGASHTVSAEYIFEKDLLEKQVMNWEAFRRENMTASREAYISPYQEGGYAIVEGIPGTELDASKALKAIEAAIAEGASELDLQSCYEEGAVTADNRELQEACDTMNRWVRTRITYDWNGSEVILDGDRIQEWIVLEGSAPTLKEEAVAEFVADASGKFDTYGKKRKFTTSLGVEVSLPSGGFGWKTDRDGETKELIQLIYQGSVLEKEPVYSVKGAAKGADDIGSSYVEMDLSNQHLYLYEEGELKLEADFVSGDMSKTGRMTPPGVFGLTYKTKNAVLRGDDYETPVKFWMPFNGNVGMHDASWRNSFGGTIYLTNGSHGCINLPYKKAEEIYGYVSTGFPVVCYYY